MCGSVSHGTTAPDANTLSCVQVSTLTSCRSIVQSTGAAQGVYVDIAVGCNEEAHDICMATAGSIVQSCGAIGGLQIDLQQPWVSDTGSADCMTACVFVCQAVLTGWLHVCKACVPFALLGFAMHDVVRGSCCEY